MKIKIIIGSLIVVVIIFLMPSIPAIQNKIVQDEILSEIPEEIVFSFINELSESSRVEKLKHPLLFILVKLWLNFRWKRSIFLGDISSSYAGFYFYVEHELLFLRAVWLSISVDFLIYYWNNLSDSFNWNWDDLRDLIIG
jgi:hypothetical protein